MQEKKINWDLIGIVLAVHLLAYAAGNAYVFTSPIIPKLQGIEDNPFGVPVTPFEESWIASLLSLGAVIGPIFGGVLINNIGRKKTLLMIGVPITIANLILVFARSVELYYFARFLLGAGIGSVYTVIPIYMGEIAEDRNRGALGCFLYVMVRFSNLIIYSAGSYMTVQMLCIYCVIPCVLFFCTSVLIPESPYYLIMEGKFEEAEKTVARLRNGSDPKEIEKIKHSVKILQSNKVSFRDTFKTKASKKAIGMCLGLMFFQQLSGFTPVISFMHSIFISAGTELSSEVSSAIVASVMFFMSFATSRWVDKLGRKVFLLISFIGLTISLTALGTFFFLKDNGYDTSSLGVLPVISLVVYFVSFNIGIAPIPWALIGELFTLQTKPLASTIVGSFCFFFAFLLTMFYPIFSALVGVAQSFWLFAACCIVACVFVIVVVPETKGKSFDEIQILLNGDKI